MLCRSSASTWRSVPSTRAVLCSNQLAPMPSAGISALQAVEHALQYWPFALTILVLCAWITDCVSFMGLSRRFTGIFLATKA
eukprot:1276333-Amphidinium_carterae.1